MRTLRQKVDVELKDACVGRRLVGVKNAHPSSESASKMLPLSQKVDARVVRGVDGGQKCVPFARKCVKNAYP